MVVVVVVVIVMVAVVQVPSSCPVVMVVVVHLCRTVPNEVECLSAIEEEQMALRHAGREFLMELAHTATKYLKKKTSRSTRKSAWSLVLVHLLHSDSGTLHQLHLIVRAHRQLEALPDLRNDLLRPSHLELERLQDVQSPPFEPQEVSPDEDALAPHV